MKRLTIVLDEKTWAHIATRAFGSGLSVEEEAAQWLTANVIAACDEYEDGTDFSERLEAEVRKRRISASNR